MGISKWELRDLSQFNHAFWYVVYFGSQKTTPVTLKELATRSHKTIPAIWYGINKTRKLSNGNDFFRKWLQGWVDRYVAEGAQGLA